MCVYIVCQIDADVHTQTVITALMAVVMLRRRYNTVQWASLFLLGIGVAAVQLGANATPHATHSASE